MIIDWRKSGETYYGTQHGFAVFVIRPQGEAYGLYRVVQGFPDQFITANATPEALMARAAEA